MSSNLEAYTPGPGDTKPWELLFCHIDYQVRREKCLKSYSACARGPTVNKVIILKTVHRCHRHLSGLGKNVSFV